MGDWDKGHSGDRKHSQLWGMSCHHLSQQWGPPPSGNRDSCGFLKQQQQLFVIPNHAFKYFPQGNTDPKQFQFKDTEMETEAQRGHPALSEPTSQSAHHTASLSMKLLGLLLPTLSEKRFWWGTLSFPGPYVCNTNQMVRSVHAPT